MELIRYKPLKITIRFPHPHRRVVCTMDEVRIAKVVFGKLPTIVHIRLEEEQVECQHPI